MSARRFVEEDETNGFWRNYIDPTKEKEINCNTKFDGSKTSYNNSPLLEFCL